MTYLPIFDSSGLSCYIVIFCYIGLNVRLQGSTLCSCDIVLKSSPVEAEMLDIMDLFAYCLSCHIVTCSLRMTDWPYCTSASYFSHIDLLGLIDNSRILYSMLPYWTYVTQQRISLILTVLCYFTVFDLFEYFAIFDDILLFDHILLFDYTPLFEVERD